MASVLEQSQTASRFQFKLRTLLWVQAAAGMLFLVAAYVPGEMILLFALTTIAVIIVLYLAAFLVMVTFLLHAMVLDLVIRAAVRAKKRIVVTLKSEN